MRTKSTARISVRSLLLILSDDSIDHNLVRSVDPSMESTIDCVMQETGGLGLG